MNSLKDTIVAISTPIGESGIGIVRLSGKKALAIADRIFLSKDKKRPSTFKTYTVHYGHVVRRASCVRRSAKNNTRYAVHRTPYETIDEVLLTVMRAPRSYTKEDVVEINCHGGIVPLKKVLEEVVKLGARPAEPGEFTKRAFLNGRIDLAQAEAVIDVIKAKTDSSLRIAMNQLEGGFSERINKIRENLLYLAENIEADIDFPDENLKTISKTKIIFGLKQSQKDISSILSTMDAGMLFKEGITCVICGKPNVGKSSLMNALLKRERAIVTDIPGTTRDAIEEEISINDIPVRIVDTAGFLKAQNIIEQKSIEKSKHYIDKTDLAIFMLDLSRPFDNKDKNIVDILNLDKAIIVANKSDLRPRLNLEKVKKMLNNRNVISMSVLKNKNIDTVRNGITSKIWSGKISHPEAAFLTNVRHKKELEASLKYLKMAEANLTKKGEILEVISLDVKEAIFHLGLIIGKSIDTDILERIFENFCIGK